MENRELNVEVKLIEDGILCSEWPLHATVSRESMEDETAQRIILCKESHSLLLKLHGIKLITDDAWNIISGDYFRSITTALQLFMIRSRAIMNMVR